MDRYISLDKDRPSKGVEYITFPTGEEHIRIPDLSATNHVIIEYNDTDGELMKLGMAVDICRRANVKSITLNMPFVPYARQDRIADEGDPLSIKVFANFINSLGFDYIFIVDPHSDVTPALFDNVVVVPQEAYASKAAMHILSPDLVLVAPDIGAAKKVKLLQKLIHKLTGVMYPVVQCDKTRDPSTGWITGFQVLSGEVEGNTCLLVDDICDGGGTFLGLADVLLSKGAGPLHLFVTHGIFSKGVDALLAKFKTIVATDSLPRVEGVRYLTLGRHHE